MEGSGTELSAQLFARHPSLVVDFIAVDRARLHMSTTRAVWIFIIALTAIRCHSVDH